MKLIKLIAGAVLAGGLLSTSSFAATASATPTPQAPRTDRPTVVKAVSPMGLPQNFEGSTVDVSFTVDARGQARNIRLLGNPSPTVVKSLTSALSQWKFTPRTKNGVPISTAVVMPIELISRG